jgi:hypothetical protein
VNDRQEEQPSKNMLTCIPQSLCGWDFRVLGASAGSAALTLNFFTEQGIISLGPNEFIVRKHGPASGHWTLERGGRTVADGRKPSAMFRSFELTGEGFHLTVRANSALTRRYDIISGGQTIGTIRPAHAFTRRAFVECPSEIPEFAQLFSFWLAAITWRRAANASS